MIEWVRENPVLGPFLLSIVYVVATVFCLPGIILTLGTGYALMQAYCSVWSKPLSVYKIVAVPVGSLCVFVGAELGASIAFLLSRYVFRKPLIYCV